MATHSIRAMDAAYPLSGFVVGTIVGLTGVGGGALMTPLLVLMFSVAPATAVGTDLLYAAVTKGAGTAVHARNGSVEWRIVRRLALGSLPAAALTLLAVSHLDLPGWAGTRLLSGLLALALVLTAVALFLRPRLQAIGARSPERGAAATVAVGALLGVLVSLTSVGAGALGVAGLFFLYPRLPAVRIVGADIAHAVPLTLLAGLGHWWMGSVDWNLLGALLLGSLPGIALGSQLASRLPERVLRPALATLLAAVAGKLVLH